MLALFEFERFQQGGLNWYVVTADDGDIASPCWPGLWEQTSPDDGDLSPFGRFGVNNVDGEILAVWRALAWTIHTAPVQAVLPRFDRDQVAATLAVDRERLEFVRWEYEIDYETVPFFGANHGFVPARSAIPIGSAATRWERRHASLAALFSVSGLDMLHRVDAAISFAEASEMSVLGVTDHTFADLRDLLLAQRPPDLTDVLGRDGVLAHLTIVRDRFVGHHSYLAIASKRDLAAKLDSLNDTYAFRWQRYQEQVPRIESFEDFSDAVQQLVAPADGSSGPMVPPP